MYDLLYCEIQTYLLLNLIPTHQCDQILELEVVHFFPKVAQ